jgi:L-alanine-DL-glutamate epimerase-like enolase superfamily enzyme
MKLILSEFDMKLKYPFSISRHTYHSQPNVVIELQYEGFSGYGEATINPYYHITIDNLRSAFDRMKSRLENYKFSTPDALYDDFSDFLSVNSFALAALNNASWDLYGKMVNSRVVDLIPLSSNILPLTSYTLGIDTREKMKQKMMELPWPIYKIKLGTKDDINLMKYLKSESNSVFRVDANCAWGVKETIHNSAILKALGVEFIEQPLVKNDPGQKDIYRKSALPVVADESCCIESDVEKCLHQFHGINIKLLKCGGISPAIRMIAKARALDLKIMVGCMTETSIGISAAAQLLPFVDFADLDGPLLLAEELAYGLTYQKGEVLIAGNTGLGINFIGKN